MKEFSRLSPPVTNYQEAPLLFLSLVSGELFKEVAETNQIFLSLKEKNKDSLKTVIGTSRESLAFKDYPIVRPLEHNSIIGKKTGLVLILLLSCYN